MTTIVLKDLIVVVLKSFSITLIALFLLRMLACKINWVDQPGGRKKHGVAVPVVGGAAIFLGMSIALGFSLHNSYGTFWLGCCGLVAISMLDDRFPIAATYRFIMHFFLITLIVFWSRTVLVHMGDLLGTGQIVLNHSSVWFTAFAVVGIMNAVNMMDGMDGLTASVSLIELSLLLALAIHGDFSEESFLIVSCMGALIAFLWFNFPSKRFERHKVFLGDTGSILIGLIIAWICVRLSQRPVHPYPPALMLWIVALPLMDAVHLMMNRQARGVSPFKPDRRHIHHVLQHLHFSICQSLAILTLFALSIGSIGVVLYVFGLPERLLFGGMMIIFGLYSLFMLNLKKGIAHRIDPRFALLKNY